jgi:MFS transporter, DHA1 family, multidrug resistance protein
MKKHPTLGTYLIPDLAIRLSPHTVTDMDQLEKKIEELRGEPHEAGSITSEGSGRRQYVDFDGPGDPLNPRNWTLKRRYTTLSCPSEHEQLLQRHADAMPPSHRVLISTLSTLSTMVVTFASAIFATTIPVLERKYNVGREVALLGVSLYVLGFAFGPSIWAPLSELRGRYVAFINSLAGFVVFSFATGASQNMASILVFRFLGGFFGAGPLTLASPINADMFVGRPLGISMVSFAFVVFLGPVIAQPIGGFIVINDSLSWRWTEYLCGILGGAALVALVFILKETSAPVVLVRKARRLRKDKPEINVIARHEDTKLTWKILVVDYLAAPLKMLITDPIVLLMSLFGSFVYALLYLFLVGYPTVFLQIRGMRPGVGGLPYLGLAVGQIGAVAGIFGMQGWIMKKAQQNNGKMMPEWQLPIAVPGAVAFSLGIFWFGWSGYRREIHWIVPTLSGIFSGFGLLATFVPSITYLLQAKSDR